jgi:23S rRNA pseudouridine1911/1915/1917 synthase
MSGDREPGDARRFVVGPAGAGIRLDTFVRRSAGVSTAVARKLIEDGAVHVNRRTALKGAHVTAGAVIEIGPHADPTAPALPDPTIEMVILHEDEALVAIDKPAGMPSHPLRAGELGTAANAIVARFPECAGASRDPREGGLAHRLDTGTSGVLIAARSRVAWEFLRGALVNIACEKRYVCEVWGTPPREGEMRMDIGRRGRRGRTVRTDGGRNPQAAQTRWTVVARRAGTALIEARLHAGRPHQIRAHLAAAGFPIVGDDRYGAGASGPAIPRPSAGEMPGRGLRLHAVSVRLSHPLTGASFLIAAPLPDWAITGAAKTDTAETDTD